MGCVPIPFTDDAGRPLDLVWDNQLMFIGASTEPQRHLDGVAVDELITTLVRARCEAFGRPQARAIVLEVIDPGRATDDTIAGSLIMPTDVRINGQSVVTDGGVRVNSIDVPPKALATVTLTLPVRRVTIAAEGDL